MCLCFFQPQRPPFKFHISLLSLHFCYVVSFITFNAFSPTLAPSVERLHGDTFQLDPYASNWFYPSSETSTEIRSTTPVGGDVIVQTRRPTEFPTFSPTNGPWGPLNTLIAESTWCANMTSQFYSYNISQKENCAFICAELGDWCTNFFVSNHTCVPISSSIQLPSCTFEEKEGWEFHTSLCTHTRDDDHPFYTELYYGMNCDFQGKMTELDRWCFEWFDTPMSTSSQPRLSYCCQCGGGIRHDFSTKHVWKNFRPTSINYGFQGDWLCSFDGCNREDYNEGIDWGFFSKTNGDCAFCAFHCEMTEFCHAFECGTGDCVWWEFGKCRFFDANRNSDQWTCRKKQQYLCRYDLDEINGEMHMIDNPPICPPGFIFDLYPLDSSDPEYVESFCICKKEDCTPFDKFCWCDHTNEHRTGGHPDVPDCTDLLGSGSWADASATSWTRRPTSRPTPNYYDNSFASPDQSNDESWEVLIDGRFLIILCVFFAFFGLVLGVMFTMLYFNCKRDVISHDDDDAQDETHIAMSTLPSYEDIAISE